MAADDELTRKMSKVTVAESPDQELGNLFAGEKPWFPSTPENSFELSPVRNQAQAEAKEQAQAEAEEHQRRELYREHALNKRPPNIRDLGKEWAQHQYGSHTPNKKELQQQQKEADDFFATYIERAKKKSASRQKNGPSPRMIKIKKGLRELHKAVASPPSPPLTRSKAKERQEQKLIERWPGFI